MRTASDIYGREPVLFLAVVQAAITLVTAFGLNLDAGQVAAINLFTIAVLSLIARGRVAPVP